MTASNTNSTRQAALDKRLQEMETVAARQGVESTAMRSDIEKLTHSFDRFTQQVTDWMRTAGRPNVGWLLSGASLIIVLLGLAFAPFLRDQLKMETQVRSLQEAMTRTAGNRWTRDDQETFRVYAEALSKERIATAKVNAEQVEDLKIKLLQQQITALRTRFEEQSEMLKERGEWMHETDVTRASNDASSDARLRELEASIKEISAEQRRRTTKVYGTGEGR